MDLHNNQISYDIIKQSSNYYLLNRFFKLNSEFILAETLLDNDYNQISNWDYLDTDIESNNVIVKKENNILNIDISDIMFDITFDLASQLKLIMIAYHDYQLGEKTKLIYYCKIICIYRLKNPK